MSKKIYLAFRFHVNFYHSYRGDTPDELGYGKDIRIIRGILDDLDKLNSEGTMVCGTWDIENYYSLEKYIPMSAPDITERIKNRVDKGIDAVELMSYNNGLVSAETKEEFIKNIEWSISNPERSGLKDIFGEYEKIVRPQECMYTPSHLKLYKKCGVDAISIYYSSHPFNGFSSFVPKLSFQQKYNPMILKSKSSDESMILIPAYNHGDIADWKLSIRQWVKDIRREQIKNNEDDALLLIDMDADDSFWAGMDIPIVTNLLASFDGLYRLARSVADMPYVEFTTPGRYLDEHPPKSEIYIEQDTADGSFDGLSSWSEKWINTQFWSEINRVRQKSDFIESFYAKEEIPNNVSKELDACLKQRILSHSTTHFGLASPVMNKTRIETAQDIITKAKTHCDNALNFSAAYEEIEKGVVHSPASKNPVLGRIEYEGKVLYFIKEKFNTLESIIKENNKKKLINIDATNNSIANGIAKAVFSQDEVSLYINGKQINAQDYPRTLATYSSKKRKPTQISAEVKVLANDIASLDVSGIVNIGRSKYINWTHRYIVAGESPYIYVEVEVQYPETKHKGYSRKFAQSLGRSWDARWEEVMPFEISPRNVGRDENQLSIIKHNYSNEISSYKLDYHTFSKNRNLDSFNNHITNGFVGVSDGDKSIYLAQSCDLDNSFAFCPMRLKTSRKGVQTISLNPFGTYYGKQLKYETAKTGIGKIMALQMAEHLKSYAPSYNGKTTHFMLMIASEKTREISQDLKSDLMAFSNITVYSGMK